MKRILTALAMALAVAFPVSAPAQDTLPLGDISAYLNGIETAESSFTQFNEDGSRSTGTLYIKRPGRMRFEYDPPNSGVVIAGSGTVIVHDTKSNQPPETYPLKRTPLSIILASEVDLDRANMVVGHSTEGDLTVVRAQDPDNPEYGHIDLTFSADPVALRQWIITNEQGARTAVVLDGLTTGAALSNDLFNVQVKRGGSNR
ncbi:cell envelope biogenesis protein LolA [Pseudooceanicola lipolyticus]|uniref:Cell envelope biogenesis protein LolA n=1 Tax=Pseudooceanicola lipolyticus TaxID=2029104 RepID=A0A2M8IZV5_9RHOB|nr:outer membrane lipoprotein carrier protein LolA [Pseudooceanicola lipolyticus]PJE36059.1 cell envelope biogenesis protein LolA [Pseudooceanicola lipolyticus]